MLVVASSKVSEKKRVYHKYGCVYASRIKQDNRLEMSPNKAEKSGYHECKYCAGFKGDVNAHKKAFDELQKRQKIYFSYCKTTDTLYVQTMVGFWKIFMDENIGGYLLYHRNKYYDGMTFNEAINGAFHRQWDVKVTKSLDKLANYIASHDSAKLTIMIDYRKLPNRTKRQKKYYKSAERKEKQKALRRLDCIFASIASVQPSVMV